MPLPSNILIKTFGDPTDNPVDPIYTNSDVTGDFGDGLLIDCDFADPDGAGGYAGPWAAGDLIINSAWEHVARRLIPGASRDDLALTIARNGAANQLLIERTGYGYPHVMVSRAHDDGATFLDLTFPAAIVAYILANPTHQYRAAIEERLTRFDTWTGNPGNVEAGVFATNAATGELLFRMEGRNGGDGGYRPFDAARIGSAQLPDAMLSTGEHYKSIGVSGWSGTVPAGPADVTASWHWGTTEPAGLHNSRSSIARRLVLMDMTVSQAAVAAAIAAGSSTIENQGWGGGDARQQAIWSTRLASTDYYSGDTFRDPAVVLP